ncbi:MAG: 6-carboxytetrahydropterin synthase, partial [Proteobacteria bacterium]|nr:6-carboxytetrahydropterin synthase [Pseudomonadota bacterium]
LNGYLSEIIEKLDHKFLNELDYFHNSNPSSENIAYYIAHELKKKIVNHDIKVARVTAWESEDACATYTLNSIV